MVNNVIHFKAIGDVHVVKNNRARSLRISVRPKLGVRVTIPRGVTLNDALKFVDQKTDWIKAALEKMKEIEGKVTVFMPGVEFNTFTHKLEFEKNTELPLKAKIGVGYIKVFYPDENVLLDEQGQEFVKKTIEYTLRKEAKKYLPVRTAFLAERHGLKYKDLRVKNLKSRWGSCSAANNINLNIHLMRLPELLIDYVILHELAHTVHKNHGKGFWQMLENLSGNAKLLAKQMKSYRTTVY
jgi:predicted metal-dependent hydrolase